MVIYAYNPSTWEGEAEGSQVPGQPRLQVSLGYMSRPYFKTNKKANRIGGVAQVAQKQAQGPKFNPQYH
jgi:hypothetical protein